MNWLLLIALIALLLWTLLPPDARRAESGTDWPKDANVD